MMALHFAFKGADWVLVFRLWALLWHFFLYCDLGGNSGALAGQALSQYDHSFLCLFCSASHSLSYIDYSVKFSREIGQTSFPSISNTQFSKGNVFLFIYAYFAHYLMILLQSYKNMCSMLPSVKM